MIFIIDDAQEPEQPKSHPKEQPKYEHQTKHVITYEYLNI